MGVVESGNWLMRMRVRATMPKKEHLQAMRFQGAKTWVRIDYVR